MRQGPYKSLFIFFVLIGVVWARPVVSAPAAAAADAHAPTASDLARVDAEMARMQQDLREQKQLIFQLMQMHDALLKYLQMGGGASGNPTGTGFGAPSSSTAMGGAAGQSAHGSETAPASGAAAALGARSFIAGKVRSGAGSFGEAYVYIDGPKSVASRAAAVEIKQLARQFVPAVSVVQVGTRMLFPNEDKVFHNVFSRTPGDAFDLGTLKAGDRPSPIVLLKPGHVEIFCNIHSKMRADVLVVPNAYWTRVRPDGSFQISGVPLGVHRLVLWGPTIKPAAQKVEVTSGGATAMFSADGTAPRPHLNKQGGAYESYEE